MDEAMRTNREEREERNEVERGFGWTAKKQRVQIDNENVELTVTRT